MMGGRTIVSGDTTEPPFWRFNRYWKQLYFSSYHISLKNATDYIDALKKYGSIWMTGYGSAIAALAESALDAGIDPYPLKAVIVSGDTLLPGMRHSIEEFFRCKCFDHYGQCEGVAMAMECTNGKMHVVPMLGIIEILRDDGTPCEQGETGEIVATGLLNDSMPLIRYRIGDYAAWAVDQTCTCGNPNRIIENISGRQDDYIVTTEGRKIGRLAAFRKSPSIHSAQLVQDAPGHAFLLVRPGKEYNATDGQAVCKSIRERIGDFELHIVEVDEIPKTPQGKTRLVTRLMDHPELKKQYKDIINIYLNRSIK
jgi:phenylacetate-CoA ligase